MTTEEKIVSIRDKALASLGAEPHKTCPTCGRSPASPFRLTDAQGHVVLGCIDAAHEGHLVTPSESARWHNRPEAKALRRVELNHLQSL